MRPDAKDGAVVPDIASHILVVPVRCVSGCVVTRFWLIHRMIKTNDANIELILLPRANSRRGNISATKVLEITPTGTIIGFDVQGVVRADDSDIDCVGIAGNRNGLIQQGSAVAQPVPPRAVPPSLIQRTVGAEVEAVKAVRSPRNHFGRRCDWVVI